MLNPERLAAGAATRPGRDQPNRRPVVVDHRPSANEAAIRLRLLESAIFEAASAIAATVDEVFDAMVRAADRLAGKPQEADLQPCKSCGRICQLTETAGLKRCCSKACKSQLEAVLPKKIRGGQVLI